MSQQFKYVFSGLSSLTLDNTGSRLFTVSLDNQCVPEYTNIVFVELINLHQKS